MQLIYLSPEELYGSQYNMVKASQVASGKEPACQCKRGKKCGFHPWIRKILWRKTLQPTPVFLPGESYRQKSDGP